MKILLALIPVIFSVNFLTGPDKPVIQDPEEEVVMEKKMENNIFAEDNETCFVCHGEKIFELTDTLMGVTPEGICARITTSTGMILQIEPLEFCLYRLSLKRIRHLPSPYF